MTGTDKAWRKWGEFDPYFGVLSEAEYRSANIENSREKFFATGEDFVNTHIADLDRIYGKPEVRRQALDFGCGVGRLVIPLAKRFEHVTGVDISPAMLDECSKNLVQRSITNATTCLCDDDIWRSNQYSFINSYIVLQHIAVKRGMIIIQELLELVEVDGVINIHFSVDREDNVLQKLRYWAQRKVPGVQRLTNIANGSPFSQPLVEMNEYDLLQVLKMFGAKGFGAVSCKLERHGRILTAKLMAQRKTLT